MTGCRSSRSPGCLGIRNLGRSLTPIKGGPEQHPGERDKISLLLRYERGFVFAEGVDHRVTPGDDDSRWQRSTDLQPVSLNRTAVSATPIWTALCTGAGRPERCCAGSCF